MRKLSVEWSQYRNIASVKDTQLQFDLIDKISRGEEVTDKDIQDAKDSQGDRGQKQDMVWCPCCHGNRRVSPERAEDLKAIIAEHNLYEEFAG
jgi:hypothetical protein